MTRWVLLVAVLLASSGGLAPATAQTAVDEAQAAQTAVELSYLESIGDFNALYDRIHPDAHAVIPRAAAIGWFQNEFWPLGPGVSTVTGVRFVSWTWAVTGVTYPYTAEVSFVQPFGNGTVTEDVVRLVQDGNGEWRWFFGRSRAFVEEQIAKYVPQVPTVGGTSKLDFVITDLNAFWEMSFGAFGQRFAPPVAVALIPDSYSGCGYLGYDVGPAAYCGADQTVYYDVRWFDHFDDTYGDFAWITVMAHEWGHHVQFLSGIRATPGPDFELQADCLAGAYARDAETRGLLDPGDVVEAVAVSAYGGDPPWLPQDDYGAHGTSDQRIAAFMRGFLDGFIGCEFEAAGASVPAVSQPAVPTGPDLATILPATHEVPGDLALSGDTRRSLAEVVVNYTDPATTERLFRSWGWEGNVTRTYEGGGWQSGVTMVYVSVHRLGDATGARAAMDHSVADQAASTGAWEVPVTPLGSATRALQTGGDVTIYAQQGDVMIRLTVASPGGGAMGTAEGIMQAMLGRV